MLTDVDRAYIAASRRSDRSLEARIESARRASEIHKKRTGRALRVTEQDVVNEEMYEEEDDDLPTQYQRLSAHLHTGSMSFNRRLHDYMATAAGVRNGFMQHYSPTFFQQQFGPSGVQFPHPMGTMFGGQAMLPPQMFNNPTLPGSDSQVYPQSPQAYPQSPQSFRHAPYPTTRPSQPHQRSASIPTPHPMQGFQQSMQHANGRMDTPQEEEKRRMSLPPHAFEQGSRQVPDSEARPSLSRISTAHSVQQQHTVPQHKSPQNSSPQLLSPHSMSPPNNNRSAATSPTVTSGTPAPQSGNTTPTSYYFAPSHQASHTNPLSMSLPPESQQLVGSALDPNDPHTAIFMAGSEHIPQPFGRGTYTYNPNVSSKSSRPAPTSPTSGQGIAMNAPSLTMDPTLSLGESMKAGIAMDGAYSTAPSSAMPDTIMPSSMMSSFGYDFNPLGDSYPDFDTMQNTSLAQADFDADYFLDFDASR
jgi:hypothetical protein